MLLPRTIWGLRLLTTCRHLATLHSSACSNSMEPNRSGLVSVQVQTCHYEHASTIHQKNNHSHTGSPEPFHCHGLLLCSPQDVQQYSTCTLTITRVYFPG